MKPFLQNPLAVVAGIIVGSIVNMSIITMSGSIIPPPEGADVTTMEGLKASMHLFEPKHYLLPFLAHALGTLVGAAVASKFAATSKMMLAMVIGFVFLAGGITNVLMLPSPLWFNALDILFAYLPMSWLGAKLVTRQTVIR